MYHPFSLFIALRYIKGRPSDRFARFVSFFSTIGITLGVMALVAVTSIMNGFENQQEEALLKFQSHALISSVSLTDNVLKTNSKDILSNYHIKTFLTHQANQHLISHTESSIQAQVVLQSAQAIASSLMLGVTPEDKEPLFEYFDTSPSVLQEGEFRVVVGLALANQLKVSVGDEIRILVPSVSLLTPMGRIPNQRKFLVAGVFSSNNIVDSQQIFIHKKDAAKLMRFKVDEVSGLRLFLNSPLKINQLDLSSLGDKFVITDWRERQGELFQAIKMEKNMMGLLLSLIIAVAIFNIFTSLCLVVLEKQNEIAILQTLGIKKKALLSIFVLQGALSGIIGAVAGGLLGVLLCLYINDIRQFILGSNSLLRELPIAFDTTQFLTILVSAISFALLSALYPAIKASRIMPAQALNQQ